MFVASDISYAPRIYLAATELRNAEEVFRLRNERGISLPAGWLVKSKQFLSIHDLRERPWSELCDQGSIEDFGVEEWANSDDEDRLFLYLSTEGHWMASMWVLHSTRPCSCTCAPERVAISSLVIGRMPITPGSKSRQVPP